MRRQRLFGWTSPEAYFPGCVLRLQLPLQAGDGRDQGAEEGALWVHSMCTSSPHPGRCGVRVRVLPPLQAGGSTKYEMGRQGPSIVESSLSWGGAVPKAAAMPCMQEVRLLHLSEL